MKVSLNWIKEFTDVNLSVDDLVAKIGAQLGAVEEVIDLNKKYQGIIIVKVVECKKLENSDHLNVCKIDDGGKVQNIERDENGHVQVVCGAPNVREGLTVAWLPPGSIVPESFGKDPFVLEAREIRGVKSNGMLASPKELALGDSHEGLLIIEDDCKPGTDFAEAFKLNDVIINIENKMFTHRPDLFGQLGVAREIAGIQQKAFKSPDWFVNPQLPANNKSNAILEFGVTNEIPELCPRYMLIAVENVKVGPSPVWLQSHLSRVGIRPINNIVDMTNFMMMLTGQPLHAFDFDKIAKNGNVQVVVRKPHDGEKMTLLDGKEITPRAEAILICDDEKPIALGGVMGGNNSEIDEHTTRILIECANFDMYNIRRTAMEHGIFTDAVTRFTKGQSPLQCPAFLFKAVQLTQELCPDAKPVGDIVDSNNSKFQNSAVVLTSQFINERLGEKLSAEEISKLLMNVEFEVKANGDELSVTAPFWRTDIDISEDIVEEVGRLHGYDKLPLELPHRDLTPAPKDPLLELKSKIRNTLSAAGANEVLTYSFVHGNLLEKVGQNKDDAFQLSNALSPDLQYYRLSLTPSLLEKVHPNIKAGYQKFVLFEIGKAHNKGAKVESQEPGENGLPEEFERIALVFAADDRAVKPFMGAAFYEARKFLMDLLTGLGLVADVTFEPLQPDRYMGVTMSKIAPYATERAATILIGNNVLGEIGEYKASVRKALKLPAFTAGLELDIMQLLNLRKVGTQYVALPRYPKVSQDISLKVVADQIYQALYNFIDQKIAEIKPEQTHFTLSPLDIYQREEDNAHKQITFRLEIASYEKTMRDPEVNGLLDDVAKAAKEKFGAERI